MTTHRMALFALVAALLSTSFLSRPEEPKKEPLSEDSPEESAKKNAELKQKLGRLVSFEFVDTPVEDALKFLNSLTKTQIVLDQKAIAAGKDSEPLNLRAMDMRLENALKWIGRLAGLEPEIKGGVYLYKLAEPNADTARKTTVSALTAEEIAENDAVAKLLEKKATFEFVDTPLDDALKFFSTLSNATFILAPEIHKKGKVPAVTLRVKDMDIKGGLKWALQLCELEYVIRGQAVYIGKKANNATGEESRKELESKKGDAEKK